MNRIADFDLLAALMLELNVLFPVISHLSSRTLRMITRLTCMMVVLSITDMSNPIHKKLKTLHGC